MNNEEKIKEFYKLDKNWNDNGANPIEAEIIANALYLDNMLPVEMFVAPTARNSIQFEIEKEGYYLEFELFRCDKVHIFKIVGGEETNKEIKLGKEGIEEILEEIKKYQES